jgi:hypothetical protein
LAFASRPHRLQISTGFFFADLPPVIKVCENDFRAAGSRHSD